MYVAMDRKPEDGCETQCAADGETGVMIRLRLVKSAEEEDRLREQFPEPWYKEEIHHGGQVLLDLIKPWLGTNRLVAGDSYFASVAVANELEENHNMGFIGTIKTATKGFPQQYLSSVECGGNKGDSVTLVEKDNAGLVKKMAVMTVDRNRNYYISTRGSTAPTKVSRERWQQPRGDKEADAFLADIQFERPEIVSTFHNFAGMIDLNNRYRQQYLKLETTWKTQSWHLRTNMSVFGVHVVDSWMIYQAATGCDWKQRRFYSILSSQLIDNNWDNARGELFRNSKTALNGIDLAAPQQKDESSSDENDGNEWTPLGAGIHLTPVKETDKRGHRIQFRCSHIGCTRKVTHECSLCFSAKQSNHGSRFFCCKPDKKSHWKQHLKEYHDITIEDNVVNKE